MKTFFRWLLGVSFIAAGVNHFVNPAVYERIMPPYLPWRFELVLLSGAAEAILGVLVLFPRFAFIARWGLIALLVAIFPANVHMALHTELYPDLPPAALWGRLPLQFMLIWWVWAVTRPSAAREASQKR